MSKADEKVYVGKILRLLKSRYKAQMKTSLDHATPWQLLVATILSAQAQDAHVNEITPRLFRDLPRADMYARLKPTDLYKYVKSVGLFRAKSKSIVGAAKKVTGDFRGKVPRSIDELVTLPGVGRKTANVVLSNAFGINEGIAIDTHCITVANRLGLAHGRDPAKIEKKLVGLVPNRDWANVTHLFIALGRDVCTAKEKRCGRCVLNRICPSSTVDNHGG